ncbi:MAG: hypothetical protein EA402_13385 [Planctomycetota bacterium]|nr:MAG: hypothetical protein EA402_13385 [Planctomycetota bacterium]
MGDAAAALTGGAPSIPTICAMRLCTLFLALSALVLFSACSRSSAPSDAELAEAAALEEQAAPVDYDTAEMAIEAGVIDPGGLPRGSTWVRYRNDDGATSYGYLKDDRPVGFWTYRHPDGPIFMQGAYLYGGLQDGPWRFWHANATRFAEGNFDRGERHGQWQQWHPNGRRALQGSYRRGQREGEWVTWWPNGRLMSRGFFDQGRPSGRWLFWDRDGRPMPHHTHSHPDTTHPEVMNPPTIQWDGHRRIEEDHLAPHRPGSPRE